MHKIVAGVANRSYGIHVARMAGMPSSVVARAEKVLASLETSRCTATTDAESIVQPAATNTPNNRGKARVSDDLPPPQLTLFG